MKPVQARHTMGLCQWGASSGEVSGGQCGTASFLLKAANRGGLAVGTNAVWKNLAH